MPTPTRHRTRDAVQLSALAHVLRNMADRLERISGDTDEALDHLTRELALVGWPARSADPSVSGSGSELTSTERSADASWRLSNQREAIRDALSHVTEWAADGTRHLDTLDRVVQRARGMRTPDAAPLVCADAQVGKHGAPDWGDPLCHMPGVKSGLCQAHYFAWYRARKRDGIDTSRDHGDAA